MTEKQKKLLFENPAEFLNREYTGSDSGKT